MNKQSNNLEQEQIFFLKSQFWQMSIAAAFARVNIYKGIKNEDKENKNIDKEKISFKYDLRTYIENLITKQYSKHEVSEEIHIDNILSFQNQIQNEILINNKLNFGVCQKILNLYLKYLWCAKYIAYEPPHFPLDRLIQEHQLKKVETNWSELDDESDYKNVINLLHEGNHKSIWELEEYNKILRQ